MKTENSKAKLHKLGIMAAVLLVSLSISVTAGRADSDVPVLPSVSNANLTLKDAISLAMADNITLKLANSDAKSARASESSAKAMRSPTLSTSTFATYGDTDNIVTSSPGVLPQNIMPVDPKGFADQNLTLMVPIYTGGKLELNIASAHQQSESAAYMIDGAKIAVTEAVTEAYANAALQQSLVDAAQARLTAEDEQVRVTQQKVDAGSVAPVALLREQAEQADAKQAVLAAQNSAGLALIQLKTALGVSQVSEIAITDTLDNLNADPTAPATLADSLTQAEKNRPEMAATLKQIQSAQSAIGSAKGEYAPQIYGVAMGDAMSGSPGHLDYTVGLTASLPLIDGGQRKADVDGAKARLEKAQEEAQQVRQQIDQDTASAWLSLQTAAAQVTSAQLGVTAAQQGYDLANLRYNAGKSVTAERLDALSALVRAQSELAQAKAARIIAHAKLNAAVGNISS
jgi:outer membrane protein